MRILVCGGRDFDDAALLERTLNNLHATLIIHGGARGADRLSGMWASLHGVECIVFPAMWARDGKAAGPIRNQAMLVNGRPDLVVGFPGGNGTADMVRRAIKAGVAVMDLRTQEKGLF